MPACPPRGAEGEPTATCCRSVRTVRVSHVDAPLALYRRYRPETFAEVIGQDHVTEPAAAGAAQRPRAPRLPLLRPARLRQDHQRAHPGPLPSTASRARRRSPAACATRARPGPRRAGGSIDVIEIDAACHGGVDDARDLRERAFFAPVSSRFKVYIVDEAHMVTPQGFNALLKLVEEPPEHVKFVFATTEPEKVIGTIRSRTHHYPFRLVPPKVLRRLPRRPLRTRGRRGRRRPCSRWSSAPAAAPSATRCRCSTSSSPAPAARA